MTDTDDTNVDRDRDLGAELLIEPATKSDLDALADDWVALAREQRAHRTHVLAHANREAILDVLAAHQFNDGLLVGRLEGEDEIVGFATFSVERGMLTLDVTRGLLSNLYVKPQHRGRGIGSALLEAVEDALAEEGVDVLTLDAMADNEGARRFYREKGYETYRVTMERRLEGSTENDTHSKEER